MLLVVLMSIVAICQRLFKRIYGWMDGWMDDRIELEICRRGQVANVINGVLNF